MHGHVALFLDAGRPVERLLRALDLANPTPVTRALVTKAAARRARGGVTGLTERELDVIRYLPSTLSGAEIADRLYISVNTLRTHLQVIYRKLDVGGRRDAVRRAEEHGIA
jgi:LuxR family maltose regulon positive regulatory protein